jgi:hypothetical protein
MLTDDRPEIWLPENANLNDFEYASIVTNGNKVSAISAEVNRLIVMPVTAWGISTKRQESAKSPQVLGSARQTCPPICGHAASALQFLREGSTGGSEQNRAELRQWRRGHK